MQKQIWRGETVLVSKLVADQRATNRRESQGTDHTSTAYESGLLHNVSGFRPSSVASSCYPSEEEGGDDHDDDGNNHQPELHNGHPIDVDGQQGPISGERSFWKRALAESKAEEAQQDPESSSPSPVDVESAPVVAQPPVPAVVQHPRLQRQGRDRYDNLPAYKSFGRGPIVVSDSRAPSRSLIMPMLQIQELLRTINSRVTSGMAVKHEDWEKLRQLSIQMGAKFSDRVMFEWEDVESSSAEDDFGEEEVRGNGGCVG